MRISVSSTPRVLWIELTSQCPLDCVFCSRKMRRGRGEPLPFPLFERLLQQLRDPRRLVLNYSGESGCYPELIPAIRSSRTVGAFVELVSSLVVLPRPAVPRLAWSGLNRLTVSLHTMHAGQYPEIYGGGSLEALRSRLEELLQICRETPRGLLLDLAFVAMEQNLNQLERVAAYAEQLGVLDIQVCPVLRRDEIAAEFRDELDSGIPREDFRRKVRDAMAAASSAHPGVRISANNPAFETRPVELGRVPRPFPGPLPAGARIHTCEQNPWETAHVLSNGDVVTCEVRDRFPLGNLNRSSLDEIWQGEAYQEFRRRYTAGECPECRLCCWKRAYLPGPLESDILGARGGSAQLIYGWHEPDGDQVIWSTQRAGAVLAPRPGSRGIHLSGVLPPGPDGLPNSLEVASAGRVIGTVHNRADDPLHFGLDFDAGAANGNPLELEFRTRRVFRPSETGSSDDQRDLGFALTLLASRRPDNGARDTLRSLRFGIRAAGLLGRALRKRRARIPGSGWSPGVSVVIPERDNPGELARCLESLESAAGDLPEPVQVIVVVNGSGPAAYERLRTRHRHVDWIFDRCPLGFNGAVRRGLRLTRHDWVYLLNNDVTLSPGALAAVLECRAPGVFAVGSQIFLRDTTRYREETNFTSFRLESGVANVLDSIPGSGGVLESFYVGGGASLFRRAPLARLAAATGDYAPFYWEDVEWGWRARKDGYRVLFASHSEVRHTHRATISRHYTPQQVEEITERNRLLFHLRNLTAAGSTDQAIDRAASLRPECARFFNRPAVMANILRMRLWNYRAPVGDETLVS